LSKVSFPVMPIVSNWHRVKVQFRTGIAPMATSPSGWNSMLRMSPPVWPKFVLSKWTPSSTSINAGPLMVQSVKVRSSSFTPPPAWTLAR